MTTKIINTKKAKFILGSSVKNLNTGSTIYSFKTDLVYMVTNKGIVRLQDGHYIYFENVEHGAQFELVDIEVHIK